MANYEATRYDFDGANITGIEGVNTGLIVPWSDTSVPSGFLDCDGAAVSRTTYSALFAVIGTTYGSGNGSTTFNVPDLKDNVAVGRSPTKALASTGGANTVTGSGTLTPTVGNHTLTTPEIASHNHAAPQLLAHNTWGRTGLAAQKTGSVQNSPSNNPTFANTGGGGAHSHPAGNVAVTLDANSVLQPYLTVKYIIKT